MAHKFWSFVMGYLIIRVSGSGTEKFVNLALSRGIYMWDIQYIEEGHMVMKIRLSAFKSMRHVARRARCKVEIKQKIGAPFWTDRILRRKALAIGAVSFFIILYLLTSIVWFIEITGSRSVEQERILKAAAEAGLKKGVFKWKLEREEIEENIIKQVPKLTWVGVSVHGTKVIIEVVERTDPDPEKSTLPADMVANKTGIIQEILVLQGTAKVQEGDPVVTGQILIAGEISKGSQVAPGQEFPKNSKGEFTGEIISLRAKGQVKARVWYDGYGEAPFVLKGDRHTGRKAYNLRIKIGQKEIILKGPRKAPFKSYQEEREVKSLPKWRNIWLPVELIHTIYMEKQSFKKELGLKGARDLAQKNATEQAEALIPPNATIVDRKVEIIDTGETDIVRIKLTVETLEEIGKYMPRKQ